jgi:hypothetical protein
VPRGRTREVKAAEVVTVGQRFGKWTVTGWTHRRTVFVRCDCGARKQVRLASLLSPGAGSYGCGKHRPGASTAHLDRVRPLAAQAQHARVRERIDSGEKLCRRCGQVKSLTADFSPAPSQPDGHDGWCKPCRAADARARWRRKQEAAVALVAADPELRTVALVLEWRLNLPRREAQRVALLIEPQPDQPDRVEAAVWLEPGKLARLAARAGVRPRPGERLPAHPRPPMPAGRLR